MSAVPRLRHLGFGFSTMFIGSENRNYATVAPHDMSDLSSIQFLILAVSRRFGALEELVKVKTEDLSRS